MSESLLLPRASGFAQHARLQWQERKEENEMFLLMSIFFLISCAFIATWHLAQPHCLTEGGNAILYFIGIRIK